jgi:hypothetical protein
MLTRVLRCLRSLKAGKGVQMAIRRTEIDGRWATVADMPGGYIEVVFDDGERVLLADDNPAPPATDASLGQNPKG